VEQDVLRLDVAVDHVVAVSVIEGRGDLAGDGQGVGEWELPLALEPLPEGVALHVGHDIEEEVAGAAGIVDREDVGVVEARGELDLAEEPLGADRSREIGTEDLEGDLAVVAEILGQEHDGHAALAELALEVVAAGQTGFELVQECVHEGRKDAGESEVLPDRAGGERHLYPLREYAVSGGGRDT
jgi:hypothetical protein